MPSTYAHRRFGADVLVQLPRELREKITPYRPLYDMGLHGPDLMFYYRALQSNPVNRLGNAMHEQPGRVFFTRARGVVNTARNKNAALAYALGFVCHFALDSTCHPYVEAYTRQSGVSHCEIETEFDDMLLGRDGQGIIPIAKQEPEPQEPKPFALPKPYLTMRRMYAYLTKHRCIDRDVVTAFVQEKLLYEDDPHHNCVFVGLDENGEARHAHLRSTGSQGKVFRINVEGSDIKHSFHKNGTDRSLYVFEAPIDLLSHITLYPAGWLEHSYVACCGTSIQPVLERLRQNPKLDTVYLCLDNDEAGEDACDGMMDTLEDMGYDVERMRPEGKDWNDDLRAKRGGHG